MALLPFHDHVVDAHAVARNGLDQRVGVLLHEHAKVHLEVVAPDRWNRQVVLVGPEDVLERGVAAVEAIQDLLEVAERQASCAPQLDGAKAGAAHFSEASRRSLGGVAWIEERADASRSLRSRPGERARVMRIVRVESRVRDLGDTCEESTRRVHQVEPAEVQRVHRTWRADVRVQLPAKDDVGVRRVHLGVEGEAGEFQRVLETVDIRVDMHTVEERAR